MTSQRASDSTSFLSQPKSIVQSKKIAPQTAPSKSTPSSLQSESFHMSVFNSSIQVTAAKQNKLDKRRQSNLCNEVSQKEDLFIRLYSFVAFTTERKSFCTRTISGIKTCPDTGPLLQCSNGLKEDRSIDL